MNLVALTCTADRPDAFEACKRWMRRQTRKPDLWIISDGGLKIAKTDDIEGIEVLHIQNDASTPGFENFLSNMQAGLDAMPKEHALAIWEDDDWYAPHHLSRVEDQLGFYDAVGCSRMRYYHRQADRVLDRIAEGHHVLASIGLRHDWVHSLRAAVFESRRKGDHRVDVRLRHELTSAGAHRGYVNGTYVGIKGWGGNSNLGIGRDPEGWADAGMALKQWVGHADAEYLSQKP